MAITTPDAPPGTLQIVRENVPRFLASAPSQSNLRAMAATLPEVNATLPHPVFVATLNDVLAGSVLVNAREVSWRYFLAHNNQEAFATAEVADNELSHVNEGPFVQGTADAMIAAEELDAVRDTDYELRLLRIPALFTVAVWLSAPGQDLLIPAAPTPEGLMANREYDEPAFTAALKPLAETRNTADETSA